MIITVKYDSNDSFIEANCNFIYYSLMMYWKCTTPADRLSGGGFRDFLKKFSESLNLGIWMPPVDDSVFLKVIIPDHAYTFLQIKYSEFNKMPHLRDLNNFIPLDEFYYNDYDY